MSDDLWMAYVEPASLPVPRVPAFDECPDCRLEDASQTLQLARLWDHLGLLTLVPADFSLDLFEYTRIFNARENPPCRIAKSATDGDGMLWRVGSKVLRRRSPAETASLACRLILESRLSP